MNFIAQLAGLRAKFRTTGSAPKPVSVAPSLPGRSVAVKAGPDAVSASGLADISHLPTWLRRLLPKERAAVLAKRQDMNMTFTPKAKVIGPNSSSRILLPDGTSIETGWREWLTKRAALEGATLAETADFIFGPGGERLLGSKTEAGKDARRQLLKLAWEDHGGGK